MPHPTSPDPRRQLFRSSLEPLLLSVLADGRTYGYAMQKRIRSATGEALDPGTLYPLLKRLEQSGWIASEEETVGGRQRKCYRLTGEGRGHLRAAAADWQAMIARLQAVVLPGLRQVARHDRAEPADP